MTGNGEVKNTAVEKSRKVYSVAFYTTFLLLFVCLIVSIYQSFIWGYLFSILVIGPAVALLNRVVDMIRGPCPSCGSQMKGVPKNGGLTCDACQTRTVVRDGRFWELPKDPLALDHLAVPPGMTAEEFAQTKTQIKRRAIHLFLLMGLFITVFWGWWAWVYGTHGHFQTKRIEELQVATGEYFVRKYYRSRVPEYETGIKDPKTGAIMVTAHDGLCNIANERWSFSGKPATLWYDVGPGGGKIKEVYQLEVDGHIACRVEYVNKRMVEANERKKFSPLIDAGGSPVLLECVRLLCIFWNVSQTIKKSFWEGVDYTSERRKQLL